MHVGDLVADFTAPDETGTPRSLMGLLEHGPLVVYFYPAAMTKGCTAESCSFRDRGPEFGALGASRVGISPDGIDRQKEFSDRHAFDFPLLSDPNGEIATIFGVRRKFGPLLTKRQTFVIGTDRRVLAVIKSEMRMAHHADAALEALKKLAQK
jgi:peroxiredoxin Q/BCP